MSAAGSGTRASGVLAVLVQRGETLAAAESLTGGLVSAEITSVPGASRAFRGSVTAYATEIKRDVLGVDRALLEERGAVDAEVARQMARGVRQALSADWGVATTGVAGPQPQDGRPVGTVYVAVAGPTGAAVAQLLQLDGSHGGDRPVENGATREQADERVRAGIRTDSVRGALELLYKELIENAAERTGNRPGGFDVCSPE